VKARASQSGFSLIEVLITIAILVVGLLGLGGLQTRVSMAEFEAYQRAQALAIAQDIADRIDANKKSVTSYVANDIGVGAAYQDCSGVAMNSPANIAAHDLCEISNELIGAAETTGGNNVGSMLAARACVTNPASNQYVVTVVWQGVQPTNVSPTEACGRGSYGTTGLRRAVSYPIRTACLTCP
jgi:type IV pilus assembly protein PilV